jgi:phosphonoacetaldehyde hydrolase
MPPPTIALVVFDWAGTIIDFGSQAPVAAFVQVFAERGVRVSLAEARKPMGLHKRDHLLQMLNEESISARWRQVHGADWTMADAQAMYERLVPVQLATIASNGELVPGLLESVAYLRDRGIKVAGTTGYFRSAAEAVLAAAARQGFVPDANCCGDDVPVGRPAPWMIYQVMQQLNIYPAWRVVKIGDTVVDIEEGRNAGCWSVGVISSSSEMGLTLAEYEALSQEERQARHQAVIDRFQAAQAHVAIESLSEIPELIEQLESQLEDGEMPVC